MALAQDHLGAYSVCYTKAVDRLRRVSKQWLPFEKKRLTTSQLVVDHEYSATYAYYKVPSPWLQVKLLRLLQYYPASGMLVYLMSNILSFSRRARGFNNTVGTAPSLADYHEQQC